MKLIFNYNVFDHRIRGHISCYFFEKEIFHVIGSQIFNLSLIFLTSRSKG